MTNLPLLPETPAYACRFGKTHRWDPGSWWCLEGCGVRRDGRVTGRGGDLIHPGPDYTTAELEPIRLALTSRKVPL